MLSRNITIFVIIISLGILGMTSWYWNSLSYNHGNFSMNDTSTFMEPPKIVTNNNRYFLQLSYGSWACLFMTKSRIVNDQLIFNLPVQTSTGCPASGLVSEEIIDPKKIELTKKGIVFWEEPNETLVPLKVENIDEDMIHEATYKH